MSIKKKMMTSFLMLGISSLPLITHATPSLVLDNETSQSSTAFIEGKCSKNLPHGVTGPHEKNTINGTIVELACIGHSDACHGDVYMTNHCGEGGEHSIGSLVFSTSTGIPETTIVKDGYSLYAKGFNVSISGGPAASK